MAFLDNSGDIILDAVLTDTGRYRLAQGNGSFKISKFALGDDEIDYSLYDKTNSNGSAYFDLNILQSPILEAFTNNASSLKSKLLTITRTNLLYLPIIKLNTAGLPSLAANSTFGVHLLATNSDTETEFTNRGTTGLIKGYTGNGGNSIRVDQGLDTVELPKSRDIDADLIETQYIIEMDDRLLYLKDVPTKTLFQRSFVDDDQMATYYVTLSNNPNFVTKLIPANSDGSEPGGTSSTNNNGTPSIAGPRGTKLQFSLGSNQDLASTDYLFDVLGSTTTLNTVNIKFVDTNIRITGATTGYRLDIPVRLIKKY
jgi:hypothetical protein